MCVTAANHRQAEDAQQKSVSLASPAVTQGFHYKQIARLEKMCKRAATHRKTEDSQQRSTRLQAFCVFQLMI